MEENNRRVKTRDLFKKIRDTKGTFHAKLGTIKDRNDSMDLTKKKILRRGGKIYTELDKKGLNDLDNHDSVHSPRARHPGV